jgi:nitrogen-specific signal transduction histidine kinase
MISKDICFAILDRISHPIVFVDNDHIIQYLNLPAKKRYYDQRGYSDLKGKSIFDCHNGLSKKKILEIHDRFTKGENEICIGVFKGEKITVVAVRTQ